MKRQAFLAILVVASACAVVFSQRSGIDIGASPASLLYLVADGERDLMRLPVSIAPLTDQQETQLGNAMPIAQPAPSRAPADEQVAKYISDVGRTLASHAHRKLKYRFHYIADDHLVNAFAVPGGHVFIGKGLLALMDTEDELAAVLSHEIEHVELRHCVERAQLQGRLQRLPLGQLASLSIDLFEAGYSKEQELDADKEGTALAVAAGYSPSGALSMFRKFEGLEARWQGRPTKRQRPGVLELAFALSNTVIEQSLIEYFRSHPPASFRRITLEREIAQQGWPVRSERPMQVAHLLLCDRAIQLYADGQIAQAKEAALKAIALSPNYASALNILGLINFDQAEFSAADENFQRSLLLYPAQPEIIQDFGDALAASSPPEVAASRFKQWLAHVPETQGSDMLRADEAGLELLAGRPEAAQRLAQQLAESKSDATLLAQVRLGWWEYRAGNLAAATEITTASYERRPAADAALQLGWILVAQEKFASARQSFTLAQDSTDSHVAKDAEIGSAIVLWRTTSKDSAAANFDNAARTRTGWKKPAWVIGLYGPDLEKIVAEIRKHP